MKKKFPLLLLSYRKMIMVLCSYPDVNFKPCERFFKYKTLTDDLQIFPDLQFIGRSVSKCGRQKDVALESFLT